ncbi:MAG: hypothetical protein OXM01_03350 [Gemmatimonadota bacterium]|nr:hypothetical protein [Gemmatimonadota bacterium]
MNDQNRQDGATEDWDPVAGLDPKAVMGLTEDQLRALCEQLIQDARISAVFGNEDSDQEKMDQLERIGDKLEACARIFAKHESDFAKEFEEKLLVKLDDVCEAIIGFGLKDDGDN